MGNKKNRNKDRVTKPIKSSLDQLEFRFREPPVVVPEDPKEMVRQVYDALDYILRDLEMRSNMKLGGDRGLVDIGQSAYRQGKRAQETAAKFLGYANVKAVEGVVL